MKLEILIKRLRVIPVEPEDEFDAGDDYGGLLESRHKIIFLSELANLGYRINDVSLYSSSILENYDTIISTLKEMKGGKVKYVPLFQGFQNDVPDQDEYLAHSELDKPLSGYSRVKFSCQSTHSSSMHRSESQRRSGQFR